MRKKMFGRTSTIDHRTSDGGPRPDLYSKALTNQKRHIISLCRHISLYYPASPKGGGGWRSHPRGGLRSNSIGVAKSPIPPGGVDSLGTSPLGTPLGGSQAGVHSLATFFFVVFFVFLLFFSLIFTPGVKNFTPRGGGTPPPKLI